MTPRNIFLLGLCAMLIGLAWVYRIPAEALPQEAQAPVGSGTTSAAPIPGPALPAASNSALEAGGSSPREVVAPVLQTATLRGTIEMNGAPYSGASVQLREPDNFIPVESEPTSRAGDPGTNFWFDDQPESPPPAIRTQSDASGRFVFKGLKPGDYTLVAHHARAATKVTGYFRLQAGDDLDIGTLDLPPPSAEWKARMAAAKIPPARVRILSGRPGLLVRATASSGRNPLLMNTTDEQGSYEFKFDSTRPIYIDLLNTKGFLVATTGAYESFAPDAETVVQLQPAVGSLEVELPSDWALSSGQAIQCLVMLESAIPRDPIVTTIRTDAALADGLRFPTLFAGEYTIEAIFIDITPEGRWLARSKRAVGRVQVRTGQATRCLLK